MIMIIRIPNLSLMHGLRAQLQTMIIMTYTRAHTRYSNSNYIAS